MIDPSYMRAMKIHSRDAKPYRRAGTTQGLIMRFCSNSSYMLHAPQKNSLERIVLVHVLHLSMHDQFLVVRTCSAYAADPIHTDHAFDLAKHVSYVCAHNAS